METEKNLNKKGLLSKLTTQCSVGLIVGLAVGVGGAIHPSIPLGGSLIPIPLRLYGADIFPFNKKEVPLWVAYGIGVVGGVVIAYTNEITQFAYQYLDNLC